MAEYYTVETLLQTLYKLYKNGYKDKYVVVSTDEEGNDYRALLNQGVLKDKEEIEEYLGEEGEGANSLYVKIEDCVVL